MLFRVGNNDASVIQASNNWYSRPKLDELVQFSCTADGKTLRGRRRQNLFRCHCRDCHLAEKAAWVTAAYFDAGEGLSTTFYANSPPNPPDMADVEAQIRVQSRILPVQLMIALEAGTEVKVTYLRDGQSTEISVKTIKAKG